MAAYPQLANRFRIEILKDSDSSSAVSTPRSLTEGGYSLMEVMIVLVIIVALGSISIPSIVGIMESFRLDTSASLIESKLSDARMNAIKLNRNVRLTIDTGAATVQVEYTDGGTVTVGPEESLGDDISFVAPPTPATITFDALGWPTTAPETVRLKIDRTGELRNVTVSATGRVTIS